jgi:TetR/AcrR family transcriptional regulator, ethionamide resistance regulator
MERKMANKSKKNKSEPPKTLDRPAVAPSPRQRRNSVTREIVSPTTKRGSQTRERLKEAAKTTLERIGYRNMRLSDIADEAGVNMSLLYHYWRGKAEITHEILQELIQSLSDSGSAVSGKASPFASILAANRIVVETYEKSPGLMRCLLHFDEEEVDFSVLYRDVSHHWNSKIAASMERHYPNSNARERLMIAYALGGMVDSFLFELYVDRNPALIENFASSEDVARFLAILWYRAVFMQDPPETGLLGFGMAQFTVSKM